MALWKNKKENSSESSDSSPQGRFSRVGDYFKPELQKEKVLRHEDFRRAGDTYYATVSVTYKISQRILILLLVVFLLFSLVTNFSKITYDNFFYLIKDFSAVADSGSSISDILSYDSNQRHFFSLYRGGLTVVNPSNISVFTATGRKTLASTSDFSAPCIESSDKYFAIYDTSGTKFSVYNSFARIYNEEFEYPVGAVAFANNGYMAVSTRSMEKKSLVHVYNKNFKKKYTVPSDNYVFDVAMDSDVDKLAICYYGIGDGSGRTHIDIRNLNNTDIVETIMIEGEFPLSCGFLDEGKFAVITDRSVRIYSKSFEELDAYEYDNGVVSSFSVSAQGVAVSYALNSRNYVIAFDKSGILLYNENVSENINGVGVFENYVFVRTDSGVLRIDKNSNDEFLASEQGKMLIYNKDTVLVCGDTKAEYLKFEN